jgi:hypothetical protein
MIRECFAVNTGIQFYRETFKDIGLDPDMLYPEVHRRPKALVADADAVARVESAVAAAAAAAASATKHKHRAEPTDGTLVDEVQASPTAASTFKSEEEEELADALCPVFDELKLAKGWWILEVIPMQHRRQNRHNASWLPYWLYVFFPNSLGVLCVPTFSRRFFPDTGSIGVARVKSRCRSVRRTKRSMCIAR